MNFKHFFPSLAAGFSNLFRDPRSPHKEGGSDFYLMHGQEVDLPFKTTFEIVQGIPHIGAIVHKSAEMFSGVNFIIEKTNTTEYEVDSKHKLNEVLAAPNKLLQTWKQLLYMTYVYKICTGAAFLLPGFGINDKPSNLAFLTFLDYETFNKTINYSAKPYANDDLDSLISNIAFFFKYTSPVNFKPSQLMWVRDANVNYVDDYSRIKSLEMQALNIYKALVARGVMIDKKGGIGMIAGNQKDSGQSVPLRPREKKKLQAAASNYGLGQNKEPIIVTDVPLKFTPFVFPTRELMLFEEIEDDFYTCCDRLGVNRELFANNTTFENKKMAETATYTNTILPAWKEFFQLLNIKLNTKAENIRICPDFSHIEALQKNEIQKYQALTAKSNMLLAELEKGIIDETEYRQQMGYEN